MSLKRVKRSSLFHLISDSEIDKFLNYFTVDRCLKDQVVIREGDLFDSFHIVLEGTFKAEKANNDKAILLMNLRPGSFFGESFIFDSCKSDYEVQCLSEGSLLKVDFDGLKKIFSSMPDIFAIFLSNMMRELHNRSNVANGIIARAAREANLPLRQPLFSDQVSRKTFSEKERKSFLENMVIDLKVKKSA